ncbi:hypothetical protein IWQ57_006082, partial [Coemansia nantahalensis]
RPPTALDAYFHTQRSVPQRAEASGSPFAAAPPRALKENPFDIISEIGLPSDDGLSDAGDEDAGGQVVVVGRGADLSGDESDADAEYGGMAAHMDDARSWSDYECELNENDPSLYKLATTAREPPSSAPAAHGLAAPMSSLQMMQIDDDDSAKPSSGARIDAQRTAAAAATPVPAASPSLSFSKPPESLSLRTHMSITSKTPLRGLDSLHDDGSLLALTSLGGQGQTDPICRVADALVYWEIVGCKASMELLKPSVTSQLGSGTKSSSSTRTPSSTGGVPEAQVKQAFASLFRLQAEAPQRYPFVYLSVRDHIIVFKAIPESKRRSGGGFKRVAVVSQSYLGLRKILHGAGVEFSLPLAPQVSSWSELPGVSVVDRSADRCHLQSAAVDRTWRSAMLLVGAAHVEGLFKHLQETSLEGAVLYATGPFLNATMRRCA